MGKNCCLVISRSYGRNAQEHTPTRSEQSIEKRHVHCTVLYDFFSNATKEDLTATNEAKNYLTDLTTKQTTKHEETK